MRIGRKEKRSVLDKRRAARVALDEMANANEMSIAWDGTPKDQANTDSFNHDELPSSRTASMLECLRSADPRLDCDTHSEYQAT